MWGISCVGGAVVDKKIQKRKRVGCKESCEKRCNIFNTRSIGRSSVVVLIFFCGLWIVLTSEFSYENKLLLLLLLLLWCFFTFLISIVKSKDFSFSSAYFTKIKRILKITIFFKRLSSSCMLYVYIAKATDYYHRRIRVGYQLSI